MPTQPESDDKRPPPRKGKRQRRRQTLKHDPNGVGRASTRVVLREAILRPDEWDVLGDAFTGSREAGSSRRGDTGEEEEGDDLEGGDEEEDDGT